MLASPQNDPPEPDATNVPDERADMPDELAETVQASRQQTGGQGKPPSPGTSDASRVRKTVNQLGDYKLVRKLGRGGMGDVYLAQQVSLERPVAIKTLRKEIAKDENFVARFYREARSMARIDHTHVVRCYSVGQDHGIHYVAIEYVDGKSMQDWMDELKRLSVPDALHVVLCCADALAHAHELKLIHRDVKPDNILVTKRGVVKVSDLGLAKAADEDISVTQSGTGLGTPLYMAPEQARNAKHVDARSDIYALGSTLYYFVTGKHPFHGETTLELIQHKEKGDFTPARQINSEVPERLSLMIDKMIQRKPAHRYASCKEIIRDLESLSLAGQFLSFVGEGSRPSRTSRANPSTTRPATSTAPAPTSSGTPSESSPRRTETSRRPSLWYVQYTDPSGKLVVKKMSTEQIRQSLRAGVIGPKGQAKRSAKGRYQRLALFPDFEADVQKSAVRARAEKRSTNLQEAYAKIEKEEKWRLRKRFFRRLGEGALGYVSLAVWLAVIAAIGYGLYLGVPFAYRWIAERLGLT